MELDWTTVIFELLNFGVLALLLTRFLFKPVHTLLLERKHEVASAYTQAELARRESETARAELERRQHELEAQADGLREQARAAGEEAATALIEAGREEIRRVRKSLEDELDRARVDALHRLRPELIELAYEAGRRMLLDMHAGDVAVAFARHGARSLREAMGERADDDTGPAPPRVHAFVSPDAELYAVSLVLEQILGDVDVELDIDTSLVGGVKLIADGIEVEASAGASLERWLRERLSPGLMGPEFGASS